MVAVPKAAGLLGLRFRIVVLLHVDASATGRSLVQGIPTECVCVVHCANVKQYPNTFNHNEQVEAAGLNTLPQKCKKRIHLGAYDEHPVG
jgi:hypothetical protein